MKHLASLALLALAACSKGTDPAPEAINSGEPTAIASDAAGSTQPAAPTIAAPAGPVSQYTSLKKCKVIDDGGGEDWSTSRCQGLGGYTLQLNYFDARESLDVIRGGKVIGEMKLWLRGGGGFNALGDTVEWRGTMQSGAFVPRALIVRNYVVRDASQPERSVGVLEVVDLTRGCMAGSVEPGADQNAAARALADAPPEKCVSYQPER
jgi:hypothetical protein